MEATSAHSRQALVGTVFIILSTVGPVATLTMAYLLLDETLGSTQIIGSAMVLCGILVVSLTKPISEAHPNGNVGQQEKGKNAQTV